MGRGPAGRGGPGAPGCPLIPRLPGSQVAARAECACPRSWGWEAAAALLLRSRGHAVRPSGPSGEDQPVPTSLRVTAGRDGSAFTPLCGVLTKQVS